MSSYLIQTVMGIKMMHLVKSREEYLRLRNSGNQIANVSEARNGNSDAKRNLVQMNYSCLPASGGLLRGATRQSNSVGMDLDFDPTRPDYDQLMAELPAKVIGMKDELGLLMLERSATKGFHVVFRRRTEMSQVENLEWASRLIGVEFDKGAKDITRVFYTTTASADDLLFLDDELFTGGEPTDESPSAVQALLEKSRARTAQLKAAAQQAADGQTADGQASPVVSTKTPSASEGYLGFAWKQIIDKYFELYNNGKEPSAGNRNTLTFELSQALAPLVDYNADRLLAIVPRYDSLPEQEWRTTVTNALQKRWKTMPRRTSEVMKALKNEELNNSLGGTALLPPEMPKKLPPALKLLTSKVPKPYKACVAEGVFPALAAHLHDVKFRYIDNTEREATLMALLIAPMSTGKSSVNVPINKVMADIVERDNISREREMEWKRKNPSSKSKARDPRPEDICIQVLTSDLTNAAFNQRMFDADRNGHRYLFLKTDELDSMRNVTSQRSIQQLSVVVRNAFDNAEHGQERVGADSVTGKAPLRFNFHTSSTPNVAKALLKNSSIDGTLSRLSVSSIEKQQTTGDIPKYGIYDDKFDADLKPFIDLLNRANGFIECQQLNALIEQLVVESKDIALQYDSEGYELLSRRACVIAFCKGMVSLYDLLPDTFTIDDYHRVRVLQGKSADGMATLRQWRHRSQIEYDSIGNVYVKTKRRAA